MKELTATRQRIGSIDLLRGIVMVVMALDHVRDFFHDDAVLHNPLDLQTTTPALFFTRWVTHFCAPVFLFLAGTSAYLMGLKRTKKELSIFLIKRGFWLIFIELAIITLLITFNPFYNIFILQVIWATGVSMIILGLLVRLPYMWILIIALCIVFGHNLLDHPEAARQFKVGFIWDLLHNGRFTYYPIDQHHGMVIAYAFIPWTGLMLLGYCMGRLFAPDVNSNERRRRLFIIGSSFILLFIIV
ncbi:MAG TPA: heparan-alpha-glucosaminide N-acetyltransferase domain-containing protein, partial [Puia sp.]|nr:heparan-alpha-glucosaminide N-acetyltransferase domain-containing protein [Puia sp.]